MTVHLVNPSEIAFDTAVMTPRWPYVLAGATPREFGDPAIVDETLEPLDFSGIGPGDVVGISIHTMNVARGYAVGRAAQERGARVVFGGIHASLFPTEAFQLGGADSVVVGDGDAVWSTVLGDFARGVPQRVYQGGRIDGAAMAGARWDLLPAERYLWGTVQTVRGCPKHCSFCSVWRTDGQRPRLIPPAVVVQEIGALRRMGFRFIFLSDDNFYPVTHRDLEQAKRRCDPAAFEWLASIRQSRFELMARLAELPDDLMLFTQITMEAAEDPEYLAAMRRAHIRGALVGIETITADGLRSIYKGFNSTGVDLVARLRVFAQHRIHVLGSFIFGLPTDRPDTFDATSRLAHEAELAAAQFIILAPFPGTLDFERWEQTVKGRTLDGIPMNRYWLAPPHRRWAITVPNAVMTREEISNGTRRAWDTFYSLRLLWDRSRRASTLWERLAFVLLSKIYRQMYARTGLATDSARVQRAAFWVRILARPCRRLFKERPAVPIREAVPAAQVHVRSEEQPNPELDLAGRSTPLVLAVTGERLIGESARSEHVVHVGEIRAVEEIKGFD
jgi:hypothetical protein